MSPKNKLPSAQITNTIDVSKNEIHITKGHLKLGGVNPAGQTIELTNYYLLKDGIPCLPVMGEFHFSRYACQYWEEELLKMKAGGVEIIATYVLWIHIEEEEGVFCWSDNNDLRYFIQLCAKHRLQVLVRIGPFAHGECRNGGLPDWLYGQPFAVRSNDERYLWYVQRLYQEIGTQLCGLLYKEGGPIIGIQLDNEYMHCGAPWEVTFRQGTEWVPSGTDGVAHLRRLKQLALDVGLDVPLYTCTGWLNSPIIDNELLPMQGGYAFTPWSPDPAYQQAPTREFLFRNRHLDPVLQGPATYDASKYPLACCEIGGGIQDTYFHRNIVPPESVEALAVMNLAGGANVIGYYMYHGGSNPVGKHGYLNEFTVPRISYDFQAPLGEFGQFNESYRYLRLLHLFLHDFGSLLAPMGVILPDDATTITPDNTTALRYAVRANGDSGFLFLNNYQDHVEMQDLTDLRLSIQTAHEVVMLPYTQPLTLGKEVTAILPFGLTLDGVVLKYATTQLFTKIDDGLTVDYFFFAPNKMLSEYAFDPASYHGISVSSGEIIETDAVTYITVTPGTDCVITATNLDGKIVRFFTLTRQQAERSTKQVIVQHERLVITDSGLIVDDQRCYLYSTGQTAVSLSIYPPLTGRIDSDYGMFEPSADGLFTRYTLKLPEYPVHFQVEMIDTRKAQLTFAPDLMAGVHNAFLRIDYIGDIGNAFIDGKLVADNFYNGTVWEIGLNHLMERLENKPLLILINPIRANGSAAHYVPTGMAFRPEADQDGVGAIHTITAVPEYKISLDWLIT